MTAKRTEHAGYELTGELGTASVACPQCGSRFYIRREGYWDTARKQPGAKLQAPRYRMTRVFCSNACKQAAYRARSGSRS